MQDPDPDPIKNLTEPKHYNEDKPSDSFERALRERGLEPRPTIHSILKYNYNYPIYDINI